MGNYDEALKHARLALAEAPNDPNRQLLEGAITKLERGEDMN